MSSAHVRGQAKPFEKTSSNKRKRATQQNPTQTSIFLNMHPPPATQELSDHHARTGEAAEDQEAAALLNHMHLMHHDDHPHHSADLLHGDYHENGNAAGNHFVADRGVLHRHPRGPQQFARENSGSSDASATNYFSGDSDLTAEPIVGCAADEEGAKSSNSGSSTPFKVPRRALPSPDHPQALAAAGEVQECSINLLPHHVKNTGNNREEAAQSSPTVPVMQPSTSTTSTSIWNCNGSLDSKLLASSQQMHTRAAGTPMTRGCHSSQVEGAVSRSGSESWLDLRLGYSAAKQQQAPQNMNGSLLTPRDEQRKSGESLNGMMESAPVTLQLLPDNSKVTEVNGAGASDMMRAGIIDRRSCRHGDSPLIYQRAASDFTHARPKLAESHYTIPRFVQPDHQQISLDQSKHLAAAALQPSDHQRFLLNHINDPAADLHQSNQHSALPPGLSYDQAHGYAHSNDQRRWLAAETSDMLMMTAPPMNGAARPAEIYRPTASLGWPPTNRSVDTRPWSANTTYTPPVHMQRAMSWQGLLRSMTTDPLLHPLPDLPMCGFDSGPPEMPGSRHHQMFPAVNANRLPPASCTRPANNHQSLRLSTSRRSAGLWFSLQEAHPYSNENMEDEEEEHRSMQKVYLRIRDGKMQISVLQSYLLRKFQSSGSYDSHEVEITCRGKTLSPTLTIQHVRDTIWLSKEVEINEAIGFKHTHRYLSDSNTKIMALCYQRHHAQTVTLNLLKT